MYIERSFPGFRLRLVLVAVLFCLPFSGLMWRLWRVQVYQGPEHSRTIARQSIRRIRLNPVRGRIRAAGNELVVDNRPVYDVVFHVSAMRRPGTFGRTVVYVHEQVLLVSRIIGRKPPFGIERVDRHLRVYPALPLTVYTDLETDEVARLSEYTPPLSNVEIATRIAREYPYPGMAAHVLGFAGHRPPSAEGVWGRYSYTRPELSGRQGIELSYDETLSGSGGTRLVRVDNLGYVHEVIGTPGVPRDGNDLRLSLDLEAQLAAERVLRGNVGALVCVEVNTGAVLAMASSPAYDVSLMDAAMYEQLRTDRDRRPLLNRALAGGYTPGSILKPLIALAALEAGVVTPEEEIECTGRFMVGNHPIRCWKRSGHGFLSLRHAIEHSCNPYMMEIGTRTGLDRLRPFLQAAGIGSAPDLDLPFNRADAAGILPTRNAGGHRWLAVDTAYLSMGQGIIGLSPLQAALYTAALANGGRVYRPFLVREILGLDGREIQRTVPMVTSRLPVSQEDLQVVREGMWLVVNGDDATAEQARTPLMTLAGKTGTAEVGTRENRTLNTWFIAFGPWEAPRFAVAALVERGMSGGRTAAPMVREFIEGWYGQAEGPGDG